MSPLFAFGFAVTARVTLLLAGALILSLPLASASARTRHAFWTAIAVALLAAPWLPSVLGRLPSPVAALPSSWTAPAQELLVLIWPLGAGLVGASLGLGMVRIRRLIRSADSLPTEPWQGELEEVRRRVGVRKRVDLLASVRAPTPIAGGVLRPFVLLPAGATGWSAERRELVLLHELVHRQARPAAPHARSHDGRALLVPSARAHRGSQSSARS